MVKVYFAEVSALSDDHIFDQLYKNADLERRIKTDKFYFKKDKMLSIGAWTLLQHALLQEGLRDFSLFCGENGKPYLKGTEGCFFNLSHSGQTVMCAISDREVGCDVEKIAGFDPELAKLVMTNQEIKALNSLKNDREKNEMFFRFWTLKESYMKATGLGMALEPGNFGMIVENERICVAQSADEREFHFKEYIMNDGYCYSCCSLSNDFCNRMTKVDLREG